MLLVVSGMELDRNRELLTKLRAQHDEVRWHLARCIEAADLVERTACQQGELLIGAANALREVLIEHNRTEEELLGPVLLDADAFGEVRVSQMTGHHRVEHAAMAAAIERLVLLADPCAAARALRTAAAAIVRHMEAEESEFLNDRVIRDDIVSVDPFGG